MKDIELNKQKFIDIAKTNIKRDGINELLAWLETTDFFTCPASAKFHSAEPGGLCFHSLNVYERLLKLAKDEYGEENVNLESVSIIALFHDICKCCFYKQEMRNVKENGEWVQKPYYVIAFLWIWCPGVIDWPIVFVLEEYRGITIWVFRTIILLSFWSNRIKADINSTGIWWFYIPYIACIIRNLSFRLPLSINFADKLLDETFLFFIW